MCTQTRTTLCTHLPSPTHIISKGVGTIFVSELCVIQGRKDEKFSFLPNKLCYSLLDFHLRSLCFQQKEVEVPSLLAFLYRERGKDICTYLLGFVQAFLARSVSSRQVVLLLTDIINLSPEKRKQKEKPMEVCSDFIGRPPKGFFPVLNNLQRYIEIHTKFGTTLAIYEPWLNHRSIFLKIDFSVLKESLKTTISVV